MDAAHTSCLPDSDLSKMVPASGSSPAAAREEISNAVKEVKGVGPLGIALFISTVQAVIPALAPYLDDRNASAAERLGLTTDVEALFKDLGEDAGRMGRVASALTHVRLEGLWDHV